MNNQHIINAYKFMLFESKEPLTFKADNPGGQWEKDNQEDAMVRYDRDKAISGKVTGRFSRDLELPVSHLAKIHGLRDEHEYRDDPNSQKSKSLDDDVKKSGGFNSKENPICVTVNHLGEPYVLEGNHRLAHAIRHGIKKIHTEVKYFNGGEKVKGIMHPDTALKLDNE